MNLEQIIKNHTQAVGGALALETVNSLKITFHIVEPTFEVSGLYTAERQGNMRVDIFMGETRVFSEGLTNLEGWQLPQDATEGIPTSPAGGLALQMGIEKQFFGLHELQARGHQLELLGREFVDGINYHVIKITYTSGVILWQYIHPGSWLLERSRERKALHPDIDPTEVTAETVFGDFRQINGVCRSFHDFQIDLSTGKQIQETTVQEMIINPTIPPSCFDRP